MDTPNMLSGEDLVNRGVTKSFATLPEIGLKDVMPNGSWLEQKQIQAALEARKHLVEVERIEKLGTLSQAEWRDDLNLAEVTRQTGGYWQFFGHNVGKKLYLRCEEALFLIEVNCLQLKHNNVTVSLQKAYSLLLNDTFTTNQYQVYASLSRIGYKVFRHREINKVSEKNTESEPIIAESSNNDSNINKNNVVRAANEELPTTSENNAVIKESTVGNAANIETTHASIILDVEGKAHTNVEAENRVVDETQSEQNTEVNDNEISPTIQTSDNVNGNVNISTDQNSTVNSNTLQNNNSDEKNTTVSEDDTDKSCLENIKDTQDSEMTAKNENNNNKIFKYDIKILKLQNRKLRATKDIHKFFEELPEIAKKEVIYINTPEDFYIPKNIFVNKTTYKLNLESVKTANRRPSSAESPYTTSDEEDQSLRRIRNTSRSGTPLNTNMSHDYSHMRLPRINQQFRPFLFWRPRPYFNFIQFNAFQPRSFFQNQFHPRPHFNLRPNPFLRPYPNINILDSNNGNDNSFPRAPKRQKNAKHFHLQAVKNLAAKVKNHILSGNMVMPGNTHIQTIQALHKLLYTYNLKYNSRLRLTPQFDLVDEPNLVETIELDGDEEVQSKRPRLEEDTFNENLNKLREIALKLRNLEVKGVSTSRHRRALSSAIKTFNKSYNADVYLNDIYEMVDRRHITLDSSSDTDCVVNENKKRQKKKKLRNPFYILKKLSDKQNNGHASTSKDNTDIHKKVTPEYADISKEVTPVQQTPSRDNSIHLENFNENWLPKDDDFGRVEMCPKNGAYTCVMNSCEDQQLYDFLKSHAQNYDDWLEAKIAFTKYLKELNKQYETEHKKSQAVTPENQSGLRSIIGPEDCSDMPTLLKNLRIIRTNKTINAESDIKIDFDVYNRDVPNFRKTNRPKPHFRIVCYEISSALPTGAEIATLHAKYNDGIPTVFAIVDIGSISYLQINPTDLPVYLPSISQ